MLPAFVSAQNIDFDSHEINWHFYFSQLRHADRVLFRGDDHRQIATDATIDKAAQLGLGIIMMIDVAEREVDVRAEILERAFETFRRRDSADRPDERGAQPVQQQSL